MKELALSKEQYDKIMSEILVSHRFGGGSNNPDSKYIKYVRPSWDMRDGMCFSIRFDGLFGIDGTKEFNSGYRETTHMYERIMEWLNSSTVKEGEES
ncbi:hypothetical protein RE628_11385 [Paenibacillus sp. D2_2]|uniref:hypothetical protein n=1 Tax=Paenibacillus sp. D2_2 TaxID=3073092 RepID=UPI002815297C|nr:hypothetical protein [Paenibacillus sp. D2_2]WMT42830.1 hypothetical protein RE628_11385 [Paenibacillus sp. D2_2]